MSYDGSTIVIGDAHLNNRNSNSLYGTGAYHIFNCHAQEQFPKKYIVSYIMDDILSDSPQTTNETNLQETTNETNFVETTNEINLQETTTNETNFVETTNETNIVETVIHIPIKNVLFVNSAVLSLNAYTNSETYEIGYNFTFSTADLFKNLISLNNNNINRIGFAFHYSGDDDDHEPFFTDSDLGESVETFSPNMQFMLDLLSLPGITHVDFLACNTLQSEKWRLFYQLLRLKTGVVIGASDDNTGNMKLGGDWIMESTHEEVGQIYFTSAIENWASLLLIPSILNSYYHTFYTFNSTDLNAGTVMTRTIYDNAGTIQDTQDISYGGINVIDALSLMDGGGINPYTVGIVDSALNKICMDIAFCGLYTTSLTSAQQRRLMTYANTTLKEPHTYMRNNFTVTVSGGVYWIATDGGVAVSKPQLQLTSGNVYAFDQSHASNAGYPLRFTLHAGFPTTSTAYANGNLVSTPYEAGVVISGTPGSFNSSVIISVDASTPQPLYYYCTNPGSLLGYIPPLALIKYTFDISNGTVVANSGTAINGNGILKYRTGSNLDASGTTYSYNSSIFKRGSSSLYNNSSYSNSSSYVQVPSVSFISTVRTFCFWIRFTGLSTGVSCIPMTFESSGSGNDVRLLDIISMVHGQPIYNHTFLNFTNTRTDFKFNLNNTTTLSFFNDTWRHLAITINTSTGQVQMYTDGAKRNEFNNTFGITFPSNSAGFRILQGCANSVTAYSGLNGYVDDYRIYDTMLTDAEIMSIYQNENYNF